MKRIPSLHVVVCIFFFGSAFISLSSCSGGGSGGTPPVVIVPSSNPIPTVGVSAVAGDSVVTLGWSSVASATAYDIYSSTTSTQKGAKIATVNAPATTYIDSSVTNNITYYYVIDAVNGATLIGESSQVSATPSAASGSVTITGIVTYQDKEYGTGGFTGNQPYKAARFATVELVSGSTVLSSALTDSTGYFSITTAPTLTVYVRANAEATPSLTGQPQIFVNNLSGQTYAVGSNNFLLAGSANVNISIPASSVGGAFNILDVFTSGFQFVYGLAGSYPPVLNGYWAPGNQSGTYYCLSGCYPGEGIYILNSSSDTDEYDDDVLYHEFGHFAAAHFSKDDSPGGQHVLTSNDLDMRLAWSEGWGDSMPGNIKLWLSASGQSNLLSSAAGVSLTEYIDTVPGSVGIAFDMGSPGGSPYYYATGEVAVAKILLDLNKNVGMAAVWNVLANFKMNPPSTPVNLELFWDRWNAVEPGTLSALQVAFNDRLVTYSDLYTNDTPSTAALLSLNTSTTYNLYPAGDTDYFSFSATIGPYTITTSNLKNGADTVLTVFDSKGKVVASNDNANGTVYSGTVVPSSVWSSLCDANGVCHENGSDILHSSTNFTASSPGTYYVAVQSSASRPVSSGRYGTYTLTIQ